MKVLVDTDDPGILGGPRRRSGEIRAIENIRWPAEPFDLPADDVPQGILFRRLRAEEVLAVFEKPAVVARAAEVPLGVPLVQLDDAVAHPLQKPPVVSDD